MSASAQATLERLRGKLIVSCQAAPGTPLEPTAHIVALARSVVLGGAQGLRIEGATNVRAVRDAVRVPIIGIVKAQHPGSEAFITTQVAEVDELADAGADMIAFDATDRPRPVPIEEVVAAIQRRGRPAMADISTLNEARHAIDVAANVVGTTLAGYTNYSSALKGPDFRLMEELAIEGLPFFAEGRIWTPGEAARCISLGAMFVVVGSAITRPDDIARRYAEAVESAAEERPLVLQRGD